MEKTSNNVKTHDFMNVESFSQLPFIHPTQEHKEKPIRLFGIEFATPQETHKGSKSKLEDEDDDNDYDHDEEDEQSVMNKSYVENNTTTHSTNHSKSNNRRRFECHYCCRNFPTSQALGGHQNAHKRERQHAKRAHLLSTATANANAGLAYGFGIPASTSSPSSSYPWANSRVFGSHHFGVGAYSSPVTTNSPIYGSRLGLWRSFGTSSSTFNRDRSSNKNQSLLFSPSSYVVSGGSSARGMLYESKTSVQDHVSLDLHL